MPITDQVSFRPCPFCFVFSFRVAVSKVRVWARIEVGVKVGVGIRPPGHPTVWMMVSWRLYVSAGSVLARSSFIYWTTRRSWLG